MRLRAMYICFDAKACIFFCCCCSCALLRGGEFFFSIKYAAQFIRLGYGG